MLTCSTGMSTSFGVAANGSAVSGMVSVDANGPASPGLYLPGSAVRLDASDRQHDPAGPGVSTNWQAEQYIPGRFDGRWMVRNNRFSHGR